MDRFRGYSRLRFGNGGLHGKVGAIEMRPPKGSAPETPPNEALIFSPEIPDEKETAHLNTHWDPPFLRRRVLVTFAVFFAAVIAALQIVDSVSQSNKGIATSDDNKHYLWTYGPTGLFVIVTILWRQVDYAAKSIQPWAEMAKGPQPAKTSMLLDYVTPFQLVSLWKSIRTGHFNVAFTIIVFMLIKALTILSTGLFSLQGVEKSNISTPMSLNNTFDASAFQDAAAVDSRVAYIVYGHKEYNISLPSGTNDVYAVQSFAPSGGFVNGSLTYSAQVDVFHASLECQSGEVNYTISFQSTSNTPVRSYFNTSVTLPGCQIHNAVLDAPDWYYAQNDTAHRLGYRGLFQNVTCSNLLTDDPARNRYMVAVAYSEGSGQNENTLLNSSNIVCLPSYSIQPALVTLDTRGNVQSVNLTGQTRKLDGVSGLDIADGVAATVQQAYSISTSDSDLVLDVFMTLMQQDTDNFSPQVLLDHGYLNTAASNVYGKLAAQLANLYLLSPAPSDLQTIEGEVSKEESRLIVQETPIRAMQGITVAILLLTVSILLITPRGVVPRSIDSIAAVAAILARSPALEARLRGTGHKSLEELREILSSYRFMTTTGYEDGARTFSIQMLSVAGSEVYETIGEDSPITRNVKWTRPFVLRRIGISLTILASVAVIVALEVLLSKSQENNGLGSVDDDSVTRYSWLYIPVLVFLLLGTLFNIMDFEIEFTESFHALAKADCEARSSMLWYPLRHVSLHATWNGLKHSRFALTAASASTVLAPFLTIAVAGLFSTKATIQGTPIEVTALNWFNTTTLNDAATNIPLLVIEGNMSYPQWTYDELALPKLDIAGESRQETLRQGGSISVDTPALRAAVSCSVVPEDRILQATIESGYLQTNISTPDGCGNAGFNDDPYFWLTTNIDVPVDVSGYFGFSMPLGFLDTCPTLVLYYGHVTYNRVDDFATILCTQYLQRVQANVTFELPDFLVSAEPSVQPNSAANFSDWYTSFPQLQVLNITSTEDELDDIFNAMVYGKDGIPTVELLDSSKLIRSYTHLYRQYMAQVVNIYLRSDLSTLSNNATETVEAPLQATYINPRHSRLVQSPVSTHLLVGLLGALLICALTIFLTIDMRRGLPKPMGSVAAVASLLAGSRIVDPKSGMVPPGSEYWSDNEWEKSGVWQSEIFRMGWWNKFEEPVESWQRQPSMARGAGEEQIALAPEAGDIGTLPSSYRIDARPKIVAL